MSITFATAETLQSNVSTHLASKSRPDFDDRSVRYQTPDLLNLFVGNGDATVRPVLKPMLLTDPSVAVRQTMDKHIATGRNILLLRLSTVLRVGIGNVKGAMKFARGVSAIKNINAFGSFMVTLPGLGANGISTQRNFVDLQNFAIR